MSYPDILLEIQKGFSLYVPDPEQTKRVYEQLCAKDPATPFPFWAKIWPSAIALADFLQQQPHWIKDKQVLELGAGIGLPSLRMAQQAAGMLISDHAPEAVALLQKNIQYLGLVNVNAAHLDWNDLPEGIRADTLLLSDINYAPEQFAPLLGLIRKMLAQGTTIVLATPQRITITPFAEAIQPYIKDSVLQTVLENGQPVEIRILVLAD
jgi:predicted nicotinamide N-methyase